MMHTLRWLAAALLAVGVTAAVGAADKADPGKLVGSWEVVKAEEGALPVGSVIDFAKDGKMKVTARRDGKDVGADGTYVLSGNKIDVTLKRGDKEEKHAITIKKLTDTDFVSENEKGKTAEFKRKK